MKTINALVLALVTALMLNTTATAQEQQKPQQLLEEAEEQGSMLIINIIGACDLTEKQEAFLSDRWGEVPAIVGYGIVMIRSGDAVPAQIVTFVNPTSYTFTTVAQFDDGVSCVIASGEKLSPVMRKGTQL